MLYTRTLRLLGFEKRRNISTMRYNYTCELITLFSQDQVKKLVTFKWKILYESILHLFKHNHSDQKTQISAVCIVSYDFLGVTISFAADSSRGSIATVKIYAFIENVLHKCWNAYCLSGKRVPYLDLFLSFSGLSMMFTTFRMPVRICRYRGTGNASVGVGQAVCFFLFVCGKVCFVLQIPFSVKSQSSCTQKWLKYHSWMIIRTDRC